MNNLNQVTKSILLACGIGAVLVLLFLARAKAADGALANVSGTTVAGGTSGGAIAQNAGTGTNLGILSTNGDAIVRIAVLNSNNFTDSLLITDGGTLITTNAPNPPDPQDLTWNGKWNTFIGVGTGLSNTSGNLNTFVGSRAGSSNSIGDQNTFVGGWAGKDNVSGYHNTFVGTGAGQSNTTGFYNTYIGADAALYSRTGDHNVALGAGALARIISGTYNMAIGSTAGAFIDNANYNICIGAVSGAFNPSGEGNTSIGHQAYQNATSGQWNTSIGLNSGFNAISGNSNTWIGSHSDVATVGRTNIFNSVAIGSGSITTTNNQIVLGNSNSTWVVIPKNVGIGMGTATPRTAVHIKTGDETGAAFDIQAPVGPGLMIEANTNGANATDAYINFWSKLEATDNTDALGSSRIRSGWADNSSWARTYFTIQTHGANTAQWSNTIVAMGNKVAINPVSGTATPSAQLEVNGDIRASTITLTNNITLNTTNAAPAGFVVGTTVPAVWFVVTNAGNRYVIPGYTP